ncbi:MAG TPA: hypothetical protein VGI76_10835 [Solirubrobacteraceae bacterium]|jgi:hypothetical protein
MRIWNMTGSALGVARLSAALATVLAALAVVSTPVRATFGIEGFDQQINADASGRVFTQAGGHPYSITTEIELNHHREAGFFGIEMIVPDHDAKDIVTELPPGLFGNPTDIPQCTSDQLTGAKEPPETQHYAECPIASQVGIIEVRNAFTSIFGSPGFVVPLYNMVPPFDQPAEFGFNASGEAIVLTGNVRNGSDFGVTVASSNIPNPLRITGVTVTFWGVPADPSHDFQRCQGQGLTPPAGSVPAHCGGEPGTLGGPNPDPVVPQAFLTMPVQCTAPGKGVTTTLKTDAWANPGVFAEQTTISHELPGYPVPSSEWGAEAGVTGCGIVPFRPSIAVQPSTHQADTPTGLHVEFSLPQDGLLGVEGIATADVEKTVVTLPAGVSVSPSAADGLGACSEAQVGLHNGQPASCPDASKMGTVEIETPLLPEPMHGAIYLGKQNENPFGSLIALYMVVEGHGVILKLPGRVDLDPVTGQLVSTFDNSPQLPFSHLKLDFKGGPRSPLVTPHNCGTYTTTATLTPWSGTAPVSVADSFQVTSGPGGSPCPNPRQFAPAFAVGTTSNQAGGFSPLSLTMTRKDGDEQLGGISMKTPSGLLGTLSTVVLCPEPQASQGACGPESQIGTFTAGAGAGANPYYVTGGKVFITGPYKGAPFGLSAVIPAKAGPFDLGTVVVRGTIAVDPHDASLTITTDPVPTILQGIPLDLRLIDVSIDRSGFMFNPTNCDPQRITGVLTGGLGDQQPVSSHFQVTNCAILGFKPSFKVSTNGKTSRANGASLTAKLSFPKGGFGSEANIAKVKVSLPKQLPSRLVTLQKACPAQTFEANPAACPAVSKIGVARAHTPILPVELTGPVYFVSHGGEAFPDLIVVLQGYNVTVELVGNTLISKAGITSTTFNTVPDVPVETFELTLPQGSHSALAANGNLCAAKLRMPTRFVAQDGNVINQSTPIAATNCPKHKAKGKHSKRHKRRQ